MGRRRRPRALGPVPKCTGHNRQGQRCGNEAGKGTDHFGEGKCKNHGGASPIKHGRYSSIANTRIREIVEELAQESEAEQLDIFPELRHARALYRDFIERYAAYTAALLAWHESWRASSEPYREAVDQFRGAAKKKDLSAVNAALALIDELELAGNLSGKPRQVLDIADAHRILSEVTKIVVRIESIRSQDAISRKELLRVMGEMGRVVDRHVPDDAVREKIKDGWIGINIA